MLGVDDSNASAALVRDQVLLVLGQAEAENCVFGRAVEAEAKLRRSFVFSVLADDRELADLAHPRWVENAVMAVCDRGGVCPFVSTLKVEKRQLLISRGLSIL